MIRARTGLASAAVLGVGVVVLVACSRAPDPRYPARDDGCDVTVYHDAPTVLVDNLGSVSAVCIDVTTEADCLRTLKDETCRLGGDVVWGVSEHPDQVGKYSLTYKGRAAHTHGAAPTPH